MPMLLSDAGLHRRIWQLAWPLMLSNLTVPLLGLVDTAVIGHLDAPHYLGGVAVCSTLFMILYFAFNFLRMGTTGLAAQSFGEAESADHAAPVLWHALIVATVIGLLLIALGDAILHVGITLIGGSTEVQEQAWLYGEIRLLGAPAALGVYVIIGWLIGIQRTRGPLLLLLFANGINIVLDIVFVVILDWRVPGAAWATVAADYAGLLLGLYLVRHAMQAKTGSRRAFSPALLLRLLQTNRDIFLRTVILLAVFGLFTAQGARISDTVLAANAVLINFLLIISNALDGFANAAEALCGEAYGRRRAGALSAAVRATGMWSAMLAMLMAILFLIGGEILIGRLTSLPNVIATANHYLPWIILLPLTAGACFWLDGVFIGVTQTRSMRNVMAIAASLFFLPTLLLLSPWGNHGLWIAMHVFMLARSIGMAIAWRRFSTTQSIMA